MELKFKGSEILENKTLQDTIINITEKVTVIKWHDNSITNGLGKNINIEYIDNLPYITDGLYSKPISKNMLIGIKIKDISINSVYTSSELAALFRKDEKSIRHRITTGHLEQGKDYRKAGRINLINLSSMERIYKPLYKVRLSDVVGLQWQHLSNDEQTEIIASSRIEYKETTTAENGLTRGTCLVISDKYALYTEANYTIINGNNAIDIDNNSVLYNYI